LNIIFKAIGFSLSELISDERKTKL